MVCVFLTHFTLLTGLVSIDGRARDSSLARIHGRKIRSRGFVYEAGTDILREFHVGT